MYQSGRAGDEAKKRKSPAKSERVGITGTGSIYFFLFFLKRPCQLSSYLISQKGREMLGVGGGGGVWLL